MVGLLVLLAVVMIVAELLGYAFSFAILKNAISTLKRPQGFSMYKTESNQALEV